MARTIELADCASKLSPRSRCWSQNRIWGVPSSVHGTQATEFKALVDLGMTPAQALRAATSSAADLMGWQDRVGSIERGKFADLIAVQGDPLADITKLLTARCLGWNSERTSRYLLWIAIVVKLPTP